MTIAGAFPRCKFPRGAVLAELAEVHIAELCQVGGGFRGGWEGKDAGIVIAADCRGGAAGADGVQAPLGGVAVLDRAADVADELLKILCVCAHER